MTTEPEEPEQRPRRGWLIPARDDSALMPDTIARSGALPGLLFIAAMLLPSLLVAALGSNARELYHTPVAKDGQTVVSRVPTLRYVMVLCGASLLQVFVCGQGLRGLGWTTRQIGLDLGEWRTDVIAGVKGFGVALPLALGVNGLITAAGWRDRGKMHPLFEFLKSIHDQEDAWQAVVWVVLAAAVCAPLAEEMLYRVTLQGWLARVWSPSRALWSVAALFAAVHASPGRPDWIPLFPLAWMLGYVYQQRQSFLAVVVTHMLFNAVNLLLALTFFER